ncbi:MAG TPA: hypothetical protein VF002_03300, partial [Gaiellaceae bacterium]
WPLGLAAAAAAVTLLRERAGLALALAAPVFPLGNISAGLAWAYGGFALLWLAVNWREPLSGLFLVAGPLLAPLSLLGLLPFAAQRIRGRLHRAAQTFAAVLLAAIAAGLEGRRLPFAGMAPRTLHLEASRGPLAATGRLWHTLAAQPPLLLEGLVLAAAAATLPLVSRRFIPAFGVLLLAGLLAPEPAIPDAAVILTVVATCLGLAVKAES